MDPSKQKGWDQDKIRKIINNNIVWASDDTEKEVIVLGNGVGFQKKKGDLLDKKGLRKSLTKSGNSERGDPERDSDSRRPVEGGNRESD